MRLEWILAHLKLDASCVPDEVNMRQNKHGYSSKSVTGLTHQRKFTNGKINYGIVPDKINPFSYAHPLNNSYFYIY